MVEEIVYLQPEDDFVSIRDRLNHVQAGRVLLVLPSEQDPIRDRLGLILLQRQAYRQELQIGLVTHNPDLIAEARDVGVPVFPSVEIGQNRQWRWPKESPFPSHGITLPSEPDMEDLKEMHRRSRPQSQWQMRSGRIAGLALFIFAITTLAVAAIYIIPDATITLNPITQDLNITTIVVADPTVEDSDYANGIIPARLIRVEVSWRGSATTTGFTDEPDATAQGTVLFVNQQAEPVPVPIGTVVRTSAGTTIRFRTTQSVEVPGAIGATAEAPIIALDPGPWGNVGANLINEIDGALALRLNVRNLSPTEGGGVRQVKAVTQADIDRLRGQVLQQLFQLSKAEMANWMTPSEFLAEESLSLFYVKETNVDRYVGQQADSIGLEMTALIQGFVVDASEGYNVVYTQIAEETPAGFKIIPESISPPRRGEVIKVDEEGRITFLMQGRAQVAADINEGMVSTSIRGLSISDATAWMLREMPLETAPKIQVWPPGFNRLPYLPVRITTLVESPE